MPGKTRVRRMVCSAAMPPKWRSRAPSFSRESSRWLTPRSKPPRNALAKPGSERPECHDLAGRWRVVARAACRRTAPPDVSGVRMLYHEPTRAIAYGAAMRAAQLAGDAEQFDIPPEFRGVTGHVVGVRRDQSADRSRRVRSADRRRNLPLPVRAIANLLHDAARPVSDDARNRPVPRAGDAIVSLGRLVVGPLLTPKADYPIDVTVEAAEDGTVSGAGCTRCGDGSGTGAGVRQRQRPWSARARRSASPGAVDVDQRELIRDERAAMTMEQAAELLGVSVGAERDIVRRRYEALHNDCQIRLTNAPTSALRKTYQQNLRDLKDAGELLAPGMSAGLADLPATAPTGQGAPPPRIRTRPTAPAPTPSSDRADGWSRSTMIAGIAAAVCLAAASAFAMAWWDTRLDMQRLEAQGTVQRIASDAQRVRLAALDKILASTPLTVCNRSAQALTVSAVSVKYLSDGAPTTLHTVHSGSFGYPTWEIKPGGRQRIEILRGQDEDWNGTATFYALLVEYRGVEPFLVTGLMSEAKDGCVNLYLD